MAAKGIIRCGILMNLDSQPVKPLALRPAWDRRKQKTGAMEPKDKAFSDWKGSQEYNPSTPNVSIYTIHGSYG